MTPEQWRRLRDVLEPALELSPEARRAFLDLNCPTDLRADVDALVASAATGDAFLDTPVTLAEAILPPGTAIGPYEMLEVIGVGGMGVVYAARDTRLGRRVAVKLLPFGDGTTAALTEARAVSSLNHPNIVTLHDVVEHSGSTAMVMEKVEGRTLASLLENGPLPRATAVKYAIDVAGAVAAAHAIGLLHRDLKPGNVMVRDDGVVKVLDFGIALSATDAAVASAPAGTRRYMSPEQAAGAPIDARSDIYAFGQMLREMLAGHDASTNSRSDPRLERLLAQATAPNPSDRFAGMHEIADALRTIAAGRPRTRGRWIAAAVIVAGVGGAAWLVTQRTPTPPATLSVRGLAGVSGAAMFPAIAPDASRVAYGAGNGANSRLFIHAIDSLSPVELGQEGRQPAWSPDGRRLAFRSEREGGGLFILDVDSSQVRKVGTLGYLPAWSPDGSRLAFSTLEFSRAEERPTTDSRLMVLDLTAGNARAVEMTPGLDAIQPTWSPDGRHLAFWSVDAAGLRNVWTIGAAGGVPQPITSGTEFNWGPRWAPDGALYWTSGRDGVMNAWRVNVDPDSGRPAGRSMPINLPAPYAGFFSFADNGTLAYATVQEASAIWRVDLERRHPPARITSASMRLAHPSVSPDNEWLVAFDQAQFENLVVLRTDGSGLRRLTSGTFRDRGPSWSSDGTSIAFGSNRGGDYQIWRISVDGSNLAPLVRHPTGAYSPEWAPDGKRLVWFTSGYVPHVTGPNGSEALPMPSADLGFRPTSWRGDEIAGLLRRSDGGVVGPAVFSLPARTYRRLNAVCDWVRWQGARDRLMCGRDQSIQIIDATSGRQVGDPLPLPYSLADLSSVTIDGRTAYMTLSERRTALWTTAPR